MARPRALLVVSAAAVAAGVLALPTSAALPTRPVLEHSVTTAHFVVHYNSDLLSDGTPAADYSTQTEASTIASYAEQAYSLYTSLGYPPPLNGVDGHVDIYLLDTANNAPPVEAANIPDGGGPPYPVSDSASIDMATVTDLQLYAAKVGDTIQEEEAWVVANQVFDLFEYDTWTPNDGSDMWLLEGAAQWAALDMIGMPSGGPVTTLGSPDIALDCHEDLGLLFQMCDRDWYVDHGLASWAFYQMLATMFGNTFVHSVLVNGAAGQSAATALSNALAAKGSSLTAVFTDYVNHMMAGDWGVPALIAVRPPAQENIATGLATATLPATMVPVSHLSAGYVTFQRGDGDGSHACYAAKLTINVAIPSGTDSLPYYFWDVPGSTPQPLSISGSTASITVPWDTCDWAATRGWVSLPNASTSVNGATFTVSGSVTVDTSTPATASPPPAPTPIWGTTVPVPTTDVAPTIDVFGPELLKVSASSRVIELLVESSGPGSLNASLGSVALGTSALRAGNNDVRYTVPAGLIAGLRQSASAANVLTLTPMSASGATAGQAVTRQVSIIATAKAKPKPKKAKKPKK